MCDKPRQESRHKGRYHISLRDKKVYDLAERRLFCRDLCFQASEHYKRQLATAPLWLREAEQAELVTIFSSQSSQSSAGGHTNLPENLEQTSKSDSPQSPGQSENLQKATAPRKGLSSDIRTELLRYNQVEEEKPLGHTVSHVLEQWFTIETFRILYGDEQLKLRLRETSGEFLESSGSNNSVGSAHMAEQYQASYRDICRKLDLMDLLDEKEETEESQHLPLPSYEILRQHCQEENSKMGAFLDGKQSYRNNAVTNISEKTDNPEPRLPLIDHMSQLAYRRRLVLESLQKYLPDLLKLMRISLTDVNSDLKDLVESFQISSKTVVFKSQEWTVIAIVILRLISAKNSSVCSMFSNDEAAKFLRMILLSYQLDLNFVDQLIRDVTCDITSLLEKYQIR